MLSRKLRRELFRSFGQFFSIFLLALLAMAVYVTFQGHVLSEEAARETFHEACNVSDLWVYGEDFTQEDLQTVRDLDFVQDAQLRTAIKGTAESVDGLQCDIYLMREDLVNRAYLLEGEAFDPTDPDGVWLTEAFASRHDLGVGDSFSMSYDGITFTRTIRGLIEAAEYEYRQADGDPDVYLENIAFVYMSYDAFPVRELVLHLIDTGKLTAADLQEEDLLTEDQLAKLAAVGLTLEDLTQENLRDMASELSDSTLSAVMPFTEMDIVTRDGGGLAHEDAVADALQGHYSAIIDRDSVAGLARLDSELDQHTAFSYLFVLIFLGIALLVISTSMKRMVEKQRTQIGTLNALGMRRRKIVAHYCSFSLWVSLLGAIAGLLVGHLAGVPFMLDIFGATYVVPGRVSQFAPIYIVLVVLYNSGSLSFNERMKEFATLKVMGFGSSRIRNMLMQQNLWLSVIGCILGAPLGRLSFDAMMNSNGDNFDYAFHISPMAYLEAAAFVLVVSALVSFLFTKRIRKLDMVEVLKGAE